MQEDKIINRWNENIGYVLNVITAKNIELPDDFEKQESYIRTAIKKAKPRKLPGY